MLTALILNSLPLSQVGLGQLWTIQISSGGHSLPFMSRQRWVRQGRTGHGYPRRLGFLLIHRLQPVSTGTQKPGGWKSPPSPQAGGLSPAECQWYPAHSPGAWGWAWRSPPLRPSRKGARLLLPSQPLSCLLRMFLFTQEHPALVSGVDGAARVDPAAGSALQSPRWRPLLVTAAPLSIAQGQA